MTNPASSIQTIIQSFETKHVRIAAEDDGRLQMDLGYQWNHKRQQFNCLSAPPKIYDEQIATTQNQPATFYQIIMLLFPEIPCWPTLDIRILDTLFFLPDHSISYVFNDNKKGLLRIKNKNISVYQMFLKKRNRRKQSLNLKHQNNIKSQSIFSLTNQQKTQKYIIQNSLDYVALLKYKDGNFIRLKQGDLRCIFTNPLYANEKFKHNNCTQYIQDLPNEGAQQLQIHYECNKFKNDPLMQMVLAINRGHSQFGNRQTVSRLILHQNPLVYLHFIVFEICTYISVHYNKKVEKGCFHFIKQPDNWCLSGIQSARISLLQRNEYVRAELWQTDKKVAFGEFCQPKAKFIFQEKQQSHSELYRQVQAYFDKTNSVIKKDLVDFVSAKIDHIRKAEDKKLSKAIFQIIHPETKYNLYDLLDSPKHLAKIINQKQKSHPKKIPPKSDNPKIVVAKKYRVPFRMQRTKKQSEAQKYVYRGIQTN